jgi:phosphate transport system permease protein
MTLTTASRAAGRRGDRLFRGLSRGAGLLTFVLIVAIGVFLVLEAVPALRDNTVSFLTTSEWLPDSDPVAFGIAALAFGTVVSSVIALVIAVPVAVGAALFIAFYAPRRVAAPFAFMVDLLAAVPSVVYGLWGLYALMPPMIRLSGWLDRWLGWIPLFHSTTGAYGRSLFVAGVILAIMILPIISAISREVLLQVPTTQTEAALALGATRWQMLRTSALPFARSGIVSAAMLGLGRALGETIAVALVLSASYEISWHILEPGGNTFAANIALKFGEAGDTGRGALIASGLVLFAITLVVNLAARYVVVRKNLVET